MTPPRTLDELRAIKDPAARVRAADQYIAMGEEKVREARRIRDNDLRALAEKHGPAQAARLSGRSLSTVKLARGRR